jgi:hypothetical protein
MSNGTISEATALWNEMGNFIGTAMARMEPGKAFSIMLGRATARRVWVKGLWNRPRASAHADDYLSIGGAGR